MNQSRGAPTSNRAQAPHCPLSSDPSWFALTLAPLSPCSFIYFLFLFSFLSTRCQIFLPCLTTCLFSFIHFHVTSFPSCLGSTSQYISFPHLPHPLPASKHPSPTTHSHSHTRLFLSFHPTSNNNFFKYPSHAFYLCVHAPPPPLHSHSVSLLSSV